MEELAIFGGKPVREKPISYGRQCIEQDDIDAVVASLKSDFITTGPQTTAMEKKLCEVTGAKYAVAVANGTAALHLAAMAAGFQAGDELYYLCSILQLCFVLRGNPGFCRYSSGHL